MLASNEQNSLYCLSMLTFDHLLTENYIDCYFPMNDADLHEHNKVMNDGEKDISSLVYDATGCEVVKSTDSAPEVRLLSRQSSLSQEWFGNINLTHPNDISVDSSLEALFECSDFLPDLKVDVSSDVATCDTQVTENCSSCSTVNDILCAASNSSAQETTVHTILPVFSTVSETEIKSVVKSEAEKEHVPTYVKDTTETREPQARMRRKRRVSSTSQDSYNSDADSQFSACGDSQEDLRQFAQKFLSDGARVKPFFWQYNAQARGPKAQRLCSSVSVEDSHTVPDFTDPVFGINLPYSLSHSGKARQGDGNDARPDPQKLIAIGCRIWQLETEFKTTISELLPGASSRSLGNQRKNQLASKICRLKKKALHAANKVKLDGLKQEHDQLMRVIKSIADKVGECITSGQVGTYSLCGELDQLIRTHLTFMIAGNTAEYVNRELEKVAVKLIADKE